MAYKSLADLIKIPEQEPMMSEMAPADYEKMQSEVSPDMVYSTPKLTDVLSSKPESSEVPMLAEASAQPSSSQVPQVPQMPQASMSKSEALIAEYNKLLGKGESDLAEARKRDRMLKIGGSIGDALATYLNAQSQMNVKAPGVQIQQGAGLGKVADMFATSPEIASDLAQRREAMMKQYGELAKGERAQARLTSEEQRAKDADLRARELAKMQIEGNLKAAGIKASAKISDKESQPSFKEKEEIKAKAKEDVQIAKENRDLKKQLEPAIANVNDQIKNVKDALDLINKSNIAGTGPLDQYFAGATPEGQLLKKALGNISLDSLVQKFQGMSRAIDTETDRKFFQETQPSMGNFETTNKKMLGDILKRLEDVKAKSESKLNEIRSQKEPQAGNVQKEQSSTLVRIKAPSGKTQEVSAENAKEYLKRPGYSKVE